MRQETSKFEYVVVIIGVLVMMGDAAAAVMQVVGGCASLVGMLFWLPVPVLWLLGVLLPAGWCWLTSRFSRPVKMALAWSTALTVLAPLLATLLDQQISQHCIA